MQPPFISPIALPGIQQHKPIFAGTEPNTHQTAFAQALSEQNEDQATQALIDILQALTENNITAGGPHEVEMLKKQEIRSLLAAAKSNRHKQEEIYLPDGGYSRLLITIHPDYNQPPKPTMTMKLVTPLSTVTAKDNWQKFAYSQQPIPLTIQNEQPAKP